MATSRQITLAVESGKKNVVRASAGSADGDVIVQYDRDVNQLDVVATLRQIMEVIIEQEYKTAP